MLTIQRPGGSGKPLGESPMHGDTAIESVRDDARKPGTRTVGFSVRRAGAHGGRRRAALPVFAALVMVLGALLPGAMPVAAVQSAGDPPAEATTDDAAQFALI